MTIRVYHGSRRDFDQFEIKEDFVASRLDNLAEGLGLYFATNISFTKSYGHILYTVEIEEDNILDFTNPDTITSFFEEIESKLGIDCSNYMDIQYLTKSILNGRISIHKLNKEIEITLDSNESFHNDFAERITNEDDCIFAELENLYSNFLKPVFKYYDSSFVEDIFICIKNPEVLNIVSKESSL